VSRCKSETASGNTRSNGYAPNPKQNQKIKLKQNKGNHNSTKKQSQQHSNICS
jgi:hypothetical protein